MTDGAPPILLQVCPNDHPPFADVCRFHALAAARLSWQTATLMLEHRATARDSAFQYVGGAVAKAVDAVLAGRQPVLVLCHRYGGYRAAMASRGLRAPVILVAHEFGLLRRGRRRWRLRLDRLRGRPPVTFAGVSDAVRDELAAAAGQALLLPNGIDLARADALRLPRDSAREALGLPVEGFLVGVVGRLHPKKNPELAVAGFAAAAGRLADTRLVLVGDGALEAPLRRQAAGLPVTFTGFVTDAARLMAAFDLLLLPSGGREAFGMVALEAMAAGVPVVTGPAPGPRFVVGDAGRSFASERPEDVAAALVSAHEAWRSGRLQGLARRARERVEREFSVTAAAGRLEALAVTS